MQGEAEAKRSVATRGHSASVVLHSVSGAWHG